MFLNEARITIGDEFAITEERFDEIPYAINERIRWHLKRQSGREAALDLVHALGLPASSARIMPRLLAKLMGAAPRDDLTRRYEQLLATACSSPRDRTRLWS